MCNVLLQPCHGRRDKVTTLSRKEVAECSGRYFPGSGRHCVYGLFCDLVHARPFVGLFQMSISTRFCRVWAINAYKMAPRTYLFLQNVPWDTLTNGLAWHGRRGSPCHIPRDIILRQCVTFEVSHSRAMDIPLHPSFLSCPRSCYRRHTVATVCRTP